LIEDFLADCKLRGMSPVSIPHYGAILRRFKAYLGPVTFQEVGKDHLRGFIEHIRVEGGASPKTVENYFAALSTFYEYLMFEELVPSNPVLPIRKRYIRRYKDDGDRHERKLISVDEMGRLVNGTLDIRDRAVIVLLAKTGIRRNELITLDLEDVDFVEQSIKLKPTAKRSNRRVFFDDEAAFLLHRWLKIRAGMNHKGCPALFLNAVGDRLERAGVYNLVINAAARVGLHDPTSQRMEDHFTPHCCRHWFTTHLRRAGMRREFIQELRGDARREAIDIYDHIDHAELREAYLACIPQLGV